MALQSTKEEFLNPMPAEFADFKEYLKNRFLS